MATMNITISSTRPLMMQAETALHSEFSVGDAAKDIADLALQREYGES